MDISSIVGAAERMKRIMVTRADSQLSLISDRSDRLPDEIYAPPSELSMGSIYAPPSSIYAPASDMSVGSNGTSRDSGLYLDVSQLGKSVESGLNVSDEAKEKQKKRKRS